ncbi:hypothetical protein ACFSM5_15875 [Lacibacterium aquatile]|uniref:Uncharacterized protein n=1 Tax=Lacibacterium aquatile TaxID=1168082 RepID=A0ABW5DTD2_9PROT
MHRVESRTEFGHPMDPRIKPEDDNIFNGLSASSLDPTHSLERPASRWIVPRLIPWGGFKAGHSDEDAGWKVRPHGEIYDGIKLLFINEKQVHQFIQFEQPAAAPTAMKLEASGCRLIALKACVEQESADTGFE